MPNFSSEPGRRSGDGGCRYQYGDILSSAGIGHLGQSHVYKPKVSGGKIEDQVAQQSTGKREVGTDLLAPPMVPAPLTSFSILVVPVATPHHIDRRTKLKQEEVK